jgi:hypothetical protein
MTWLGIGRCEEISEKMLWSFGEEVGRVIGGRGTRGGREEGEEDCSEKGRKEMAFHG